MLLLNFQAGFIICHMLLFNIEITDEARKSLQAYVDELLKWNRTVNLIGRSTEDNVWENHIRDSLELFPYLEADPCLTVIDIGSGGGIPAIPLSILLPGRKFFLTDRDSKKLAFLEIIAARLRLNASVIDINAGFIFRERSIIISRAYSSVKNIIKWAGVHAPGAVRYYLLKGVREGLMDELAEAGNTALDYEIVSLVKGNLLIINPEFIRNPD
ncbi:MAG: 16S rRNA (guanine(527)-N(7))-methyltransferase RsmG [Brevinematales bacterium]|jgi:16S rRNA (guanine527-N7)-methyltransferase